MLLLLAPAPGFTPAGGRPAAAEPRGRGRRLAPAPARLALSDPGAEPRISLHLSRLLSESRSIRCPFWRRRAGDSLEVAIAVADELTKFVVARHKSVDFGALEELLLAPPPARPKARGLALEAVMEAVRADFEDGQYYVTGQLTQAVYSDDCFFDGPDPDMPVRSLQRYSDALQGLFDPQQSSIELIALEPRGERRFAAHWRLRGALRLPWRPRIPEYTGATLYEVDADGLICCHVEAWSISALEAFVTTLFSGLQRRGGGGGASARLDLIEAAAEREHTRALARLARPAPRTGELGSVQVHEQ